MSIVERLRADRNLPDEELKTLLESDRFDEELFKAADEVRRSVYGTEVFLRGLIEFTNYCKNNCKYCGIRCGNKNAERYRLSHEDIPRRTAHSTSSSTSAAANSITKDSAAQTSSVTATSEERIAASTSGSGKAECETDKASRPSGISSLSPTRTKMPTRTSFKTRAIINS